MNLGVIAIGRSEFTVLGTSAVVLTANEAGLATAVAAARAEIDAIDLACSRFRPDSDLERVNDAAGSYAPVGPVLLDALDVALAAAVMTDGDVDPTIGTALRLLGYDRDFASVTDGPTVARFGEVAGWKVVDVDRARSRVRVPIGVRLDLGATAKALAADRAAAAAAQACDCGVLVSIGGDIACAGEAPAHGWLVRVAEWHAADPSGPGQDIVLRDGGLATSSTTVRHWQRGASDMHHIVDPTTGRSAATVWRTVSVAAATCVQANVATTAAIVRGRDGHSWLSSLGVPARLVHADGRVELLGGWPQDVDE